MSVDILSIGAGNVRSIQHWIESAFISTRIVHRASDIKSDILILPGVGAAGFYMERLKSGSFDKAIIEHTESGKRLIGICLGFQVLSSHTEEDGGIEGLGLLPGEVIKLSDTTHNGWESFDLQKCNLRQSAFCSPSQLTRKQKVTGRVFYNHEYGYQHTGDVDAFELPISESFNKYNAMLVKDNILGLQFHPEKSQQTGHELLKLML
ncbi:MULTISPECIES: imidazole glycerol phosphate synthase subunit HisH [Shewanella]|uniref:imidazole glycerol phosphate synthase subunit HisH n=1 Tax=Shewanella TaxID=22 RepID=UPI001BBDAD17|nr:MULTISPECIES: imidazole glycerol phosphate synthase subunit HisH [Shewanella]GIU50571.1 imidazole glycerol phosphate synthase subunit HisH [Shewanella sp. KT0246]